MTHTLRLNNIGVSLDQKEIIQGLSLSVNSGEIHALMGPNGSGKSTLTKAIMSHPSYRISAGQIFFDEEDITELETYKKALKGIFIGFQYPTEIAGISIANFLKHVADARLKKLDPEAKPIAPGAFMSELRKLATKLGIEQDWLGRGLNEGFSGGEKKKLELLALATQKPSFALLDEIDSGLDVDALKTVSESISALKEELNLGIVIITHYERLLEYVRPDFVHIFFEGRIVKSGSHDLARYIEEHGYNEFIK